MGRPGHGDGFGGDALDASPRRLRRMQRARLTSDDQQATSGRRRVTPLVPWWWEDYVKTGAGLDGPTPDARGRRGDGAASDSSSSVNSTISLSASPHVFRIPCGSMMGAPSPSVDSTPWQTCDAGTGAMLARFTEVVDSQSRSCVHKGTQQASTAARSDGVDLSVELIHAAAELVDSIESWPVEFGEQGAGIAKAHQSRDLACGERTDGASSECSLPTSESGRLPVSAPAGRRAKTQKGSEGTAPGVAQSSNTESMLTFVSTVLAAPTDNEVDCVNGFELLQGSLRALFGSASPVEVSQLKAVDIANNDVAMESKCPALIALALPGGKTC